MKKIITEFINPIPSRPEYQWGAHREGYDGSFGGTDLLGIGATEQEAIDDLVTQERGGIARYKQIKANQ
jgi:hypothetical protein